MSFAAIIEYYRQNSLKCIMLVAFTFRLLAAIFSTGYGMHDDHFITVEVAQSWIDGTNRDFWLPVEGLNITPSGHSLTYPGILYGTFSICEKIGIDDPATKMFIIRLLQALFSLIVVYYGYKIIRELYGEKAAISAGWLLATFWFIPMMSVRNLVEVFCVPFLMMGVWLIVNNKEDRLLKFLWAGFVIGLAFSIRFQTSTFIGGLGLALLFKKKFHHTVIFGIGVLISVFLLQGGVDMVIWKRPFAEFMEYSNYNLQHANDYWTAPWYNYILLVSGLLIPPVSLFLIFGVFRNWKKHLIIFLPVLAFFVFHSIFPNKQERFIFPVLPFIIMMGIAAWTEFYEQSSFWKRNQKLYKGSWMFFVVLNSVLLLGLTLSSSKKNRVDAMSYLSKYRDIHCFVVENMNHDGNVSMPFFYLKKQWPIQYDLYQNVPAEQMKNYLDSTGKCKPQFVLFLEEKNIDERITNFKKLYPQITYETTIDPSFLDKVMHWLNPVNINQTTVIYKIN